MTTPRIVFSSFLALVALVSIGGLAVGGLQGQCQSRGLGGASRAALMPAMNARNLKLGGAA